MPGPASLDVFDFGVLLQALSNNLKVGVLAVRSGSRVKYLHLDRSRIDCVYTRKAKVSLGKVLWNYRAAQKSTIRGAMDAVAARPEKGPLGRYLVEEGLVPEAQVRRAHTYQVIEEVLELFYWSAVGFEFYTGEAARALLEDPALVPVGEPVEIDGVLLACSKTIDDIAKFNEVTPSLRDVYELQPGGLDAIEEAVPDPIAREFLLLIDGVRDMREVLRDMRLNRFDALELFYRFRTCGWLRPKNSFELLMLAENRRAEFSLEKRARILERVDELGVEGFPVLVRLAETYEELGDAGRAARLHERHAQECLDSGQDDEAVASARRARELRPNDPAYRELEIDVLAATHRIEDAASAQLDLARVRIEAGALDEARAGLRAVLRLRPDDAEAWAMLADLEERLGRPHRAAACRRRRAATLEARGDVADAVESLRRAQALCPQAWSVRYRLADLLHAAGRGDAAVQGLADFVTELTGGYAGAPDGFRREHLSRVEEKMRAMGGLASSAARTLGHAWAGLGERDRAIAVYREAAETLSRAKRHRGAVQVLDALLELTPDDHETRLSLAREHAAAGDGDRALAHLRRLSGTFMSARRWEDARDVYLQMLKVDPACPDAHRGLARALLYLGESDLAAEHHHRVGLIYRGYGRPEEAAPYLREAVDRRPNDAGLLEEYCELLLSMPGRRDEALHALSALVELWMRQDVPARAAIALTRILALDDSYPGAKPILKEAARQLLTLAESSEEISADEARRLMEAARSAQG